MHNQTKILNNKTLIIETRDPKQTQKHAQANLYCLKKTHTSNQQTHVRKQSKQTDTVMTCKKKKKTKFAESWIKAHHLKYFKNKK